MKNMRLLQEMEAEERAALLGVSCEDAVLPLYVSAKTVARELTFCPAEAEERAGRKGNRKKGCSTYKRDGRVCQNCRLAWLQRDPQREALTEKKAQKKEGRQKASPPKEKKETKLAPTAQKTQEQDNTEKRKTQSRN